ncbi:PhoPQ-activated pathogenicity-related family protein [Phycisphaerales bacterium AB-hyl4]|uniref:PhoPQ-activated pathogenicity-related family protein n=1 Tax=Natronomicrosphaera hydrolytica TaxID=3242702 RepID=A0ABV4U1Z1_9BACT
MKQSSRFAGIGLGVVACLLCLASLALAPLAEARADDPTQALVDYVALEDDSFEWHVRQRTRLGNCDAVELTMTSQTWRGMTWQHRLFLIVPDNIADDADALLVIEGGRWSDSDAEPLAEGAPPAYPREATMLATFAQQLRAPVAILLNVPRQPIFNGRREDQAIAYTFDHYLNTGEQDWPLLLPMVKSAVRGMDAVQAFAKEDRGLQIDQFTVTGASKRGWTAWLAGAVDDRVMALAPMVIDMLNINEQFPHQVESWGVFSPRIDDYTKIDLANRIMTPRGQELRQIVDPHAYLDRLTQPKMVLLGTNDGYWTLDALNLYWDDLEGEKFIVYVPNADHDLSMDWQRILGGLQALHRHAVGEQALPELQWSYASTTEGVTLSIEPGESVSRVRLWSATADSRDFRKARWTSRNLAADDDGHYIAEVETPEQGYLAVYAELTYPRQLLPLHLATTIRMLPSGDEASVDAN